MNKIIACIAAVAFVATPAVAGNKNNQFKNWKHNQQYDHTYNYNYNYTYKYKNNNNNNEAWAAVGGFLGGLVIGGALAQPGPAPGYDYYYAQPGAQCNTIFERRWNDVYQMWENIPHTVCGGY
jgi:hypothetical protein